MRVFIAAPFYTHWGDWHPAMMDDPEATRQVAGGETAMVRSAQGFARNGCETYVFYHGQPCRHRGVDYLPMGLFETMGVTLEHDLLVSWEEPRIFNIATRSRLRWLSFQCNHSQVGVFDHLIDRYVFVSRWHSSGMWQRDRTMDRTKMMICPNSVDLRRYEQPSNGKYPHRVIHSSSPDRGLHHLLRVWPKVREKVPDAELLCCYQMSEWLAVVKKRQAEGWTLNTTDRGLEVARRLEELKDQGVSYIDGTGQWPLARLQMASGAMVYPCDPVAPTEGFSISVLEGLAAGIPVVTTYADALPELWGDVTMMLNLPINEAALVDAVESVLTDESLRADMIEKGRERASHYSSEVVGDMFYYTLAASLQTKTAPEAEAAAETNEAEGAVFYGTISATQPSWGDIAASLQENTAPAAEPAVEAVAENPSS